MPYYNPYYAQQLAQAYTPMQVSQQNVASVQGQNGLIWVQGEAGAKSYMITPNSTVLLMDSESQRFYIKSSDASGMPQPLRIFEYSEIVQNAPQSASASQAIDYSSFATKAEFDAFKTEIEGVVKGVREHGKSAVSRADQRAEG